PANVSKATGLAAALRELGLSSHEVVGVGDAENDHAFLAVCECAVAVANALPAVKDHADLQTRADHGDGVVELIEQIVANDLRGLEAALTRHTLTIGTGPDGVPATLASYGPSVLVAGAPAAGRVTVAKAMMQQLVARHYQFCVLDVGGMPMNSLIIRLGDN